MEQTKDIQKVTLENVCKVYSGRLGCMCGCRGKYWYNIQGGRERGMVTKILKKLKNTNVPVTVDVAECRYQTTIGHSFLNIFSVEIDNRNYVLYLHDTADLSKCKECGWKF